ncbi:nicotinate-nucleotide--dimethylbenzimidazole phosphoribosyltransferase [Streptomyces sp. HPF1205]|uniref:nicotinate-nucleotide--dimethylbenzimidazole phosphoribosyltransferase n=1 Tax=Streptomyces sp. HPF1205 TaxID=2873262 RepID=UPI001CEC5510|nr:nicotinate-nucleotide--dimethylbenzimidazole phosphoribosyltransferase [Streptomyces sp. HPF1205]
MTDTGQIPGEGLPGSGVGEAVHPPHTDVPGLPGNGVPQQQPGWGADQQAGTPAGHAAGYQGDPGYGYLDHPAPPGTPLDDEDDVLLMPGPQSNWSDPQPVPPPPPVQVQAPDGFPVEAGLDQAHAPAQPPAPDTPVAQAAVPPAPRRPLHMGPPGTDTPSGGVSVRSLADRGPAVHAQGPQTAGPEYLDLPADAAVGIPAQQTGPDPAQPATAWPAPQDDTPSQQSLIPHADSTVPARAGTAEQPGARTHAAVPAAAGNAAPAAPAPEAAPAAPAPEAVAAAPADSAAPVTVAAADVSPAGAPDLPAVPDAAVPDAAVPDAAAPGADVSQGAVAAPEAAPDPAGTEAGAGFEPHPEARTEAVQAPGAPVVVTAEATAADAPAPSGRHAAPESPVPVPVAEPAAVPEPAPAAEQAPAPAAAGAPVPDAGKGDGAIPAPTPAEAAAPEPAASTASAAAPEPAASVQPPEPDQAPAPAEAESAPATPAAAVAPGPDRPADQAAGEGSGPADAGGPVAPAPVPVTAEAPQPAPQAAGEGSTGTGQPEPTAVPEGTAPDTAAAEGTPAAAAPEAAPSAVATADGEPSGTAPAAEAGGPAPSAPAEPAGAQGEAAPGHVTPAAAPGSTDEDAAAPAVAAVQADGAAAAGTPLPAPGTPEADAPAQAVAEALPEPAGAAAADPSVPAGEPAEPVDGADPAPAPAAEAEGTAAEPYEPAVREAVHRVIRERRDVRNGFLPDPIPHDVLLRVLEAAHTAPSVGHSQPWDFVVIRSEKTREKMHALAMRQREAYAKTLPKARARQFRELKIEAILDTPVNIVVTADPTRGGRHTLGRHTQPQMAPYSSALAVENLWLAARAEGLGVGWVSFFDERQMVAELGLPEHLEVVAYLCVGYVEEFPEEPELMQAGWSQRRPLSWVVHEEEYGNRALPGEEPHDLLEETLRGIRPLDAKALGEAWERQKRMTKPAGALGMLEIISAQLCGLSRMCPPPVPEPAAVAIFAGDHGVHAQGVTAWPQEVTTQMVANFLAGGAVCNAFANQVGAEVCVIDVGVAGELPSTPGLMPRKVRPGTADFTAGPAMSREEAVRALEVGIETARDLVAAGNKALLTGEMGIANTTTSAALIAVFTGADPTEVTGRGTGINDEMHARKVDVVRRALELHRPDPGDPIGVLAAVGGLEHAAMAGLLLGAAALRTPVILDGVSAGAAALVARAIAPEVLAACIAGHRSAEPGHMAALTTLGLRPLVDLDLRLGEGTGALLALPLVQSAARVMHEVATFDAAGVTEKGVTTTEQAQ